LAFELAKKYNDMRKPEEGKKVYQRILDKNVAEAKFITVPYYRDKHVNGYEFAKFKVGAGFSRDANPKLLRDYLDEFPDGEFTESAYSTLANYYSNRGSFEEADQFFEELLEKYPKHPNMLTSYIRYCTDKKRNLEKAVEIADKIIKIRHVSSNNPWINQARLLAVTPDSILLEEKYGSEHLKRRKSRFVSELWFYAGFWLRRNQNVESAKEAVQLLIELEPDRGFQRMTIAQSLIRGGMIEDAKEFYGPEFINNHLDNTQEIEWYVQTWADQENSPEGMLELAKKLYDNNPDQMRTTQSLAKLYLKNNDVKSAVKVFGPNWIKDYWDDHSILNSYAWFWAELEENLDHALKAAKRSVSLAPDNHFDIETLAVVHWKRGNLKEAIKLEEKAIDLITKSGGLSYYKKRYEERLIEMKTELKGREP